MTPEQPNPEGVDFSNYMDKNSAETPSTPPLTEAPKKRRLSKRVMIMLGILIFLAVVQLILYILSRPPQPQIQATINKAQAS